MLNNVLNFFNPSRRKETGEENAARFALAVARIAKDDRFIIMSAAQVRGGTDEERYNWEWMQNQKWRERVIELMKDVPVRGARFIQPDSLDGWTFHAFSTAGEPRVAQLGLDEML